MAVDSVGNYTAPKFHLWDRVLVWRNEKWHRGKIVRVYDEDTYTKEHYPEGRPYWDTRSNNLDLYDIELADSGDIWTGYFDHGLRRITEV